MDEEGRVAVPTEELQTHSNTPSLLPTVPITPNSSLPTSSLPTKRRFGPFASPQDVFLGRQHVDNSDVESIESTEELKTERNKQRRSTSTKIDLANIPEVNIILPLKSVIALYESQTMCKSCRRTKNETEYELETFGIAHSLHARCVCGKQSSARANIREQAKEKIIGLVDGQCFSNKVNATDFDINSKILLALQLGGGGRQELNNICGMLDLANNPMDKQLPRLMENIGKAILELGDEILDENLEIEKTFSPDDDSKINKLLSVSNDARWDKRGSGRRYDSMSGCSVMMGNRSSLVVGLEAMSMKCWKCTAKKYHTPDVCSKNFEGSSKGMEAAGALTLVNRITKEENECFIKQFVSDDDSTCRAVLTHSYKEAVAAGMMSRESIPRYNSQKKGLGKGRPKDDIGKLPLRHPPMDMLADKGHRNRNHHAKMFSLAGKSGVHTKGITSVDCERYKRRMSYTLRLHSGGTFEEFKTAILATLEHHFDNHEYCGDWCKAKIADEKDKKTHSMRFRCKKENEEMYNYMKEIHEKFMDDDLLRQLHHQWNTNAVEGFNKLITKFLPKDRNYAKTIENKVRIHLAMGLLSLGYKRFYKRLFRKLGLTRGELCRLFLRSEDVERQWRKKYRQKTSTKKARMKLLYKKIREGREKLVEDKKKGLMYETGMMGPNGKDKDNEPSSSSKKKKPSGPCQHCGKFGHVRKSHSDCDQNPKKVASMRATSVENGDGTPKKGVDYDSESSISDNEETSSNLAELAEMEELEEGPFDDVRAIKTTKFDFE